MDTIKNFVDFDHIFSYPSTF